MHSHIQSMVRSFLILSIVSSTLWAKPGRHFQTNSFADVARVVEEKIQTFGAERVLLALDIDNTTLATDSHLGSEHWFLWQAKLLEEQNKSEAVGKSISELLKLQAGIIALSSMHPVESRIPVDLTRWGRQGAKMMALTSRGVNQHDATVRELARNRFPYARFAPGPVSRHLELFIPYDLTAIEQSGLTQKEAEQFKLGPASEVMWGQGVFLTEGQDKGVMLRTLLHRLSQQFDAIVFIDDRLKHSERIQAAFSELQPEVTTIQYTHESERIKSFYESDKSEAKLAWLKFRELLEQVNKGFTL